MSVPTPAQRVHYAELTKNGPLMALLNDSQRILVQRAARPNATFSHMSTALDILRTVRDQATAAGLDPTPTPENTYPDRAAAWVRAYTAFQTKVRRADSLAKVVDRPLPPDGCDHCGHRHADGIQCKAPIPRANTNEHTPEAHRFVACTCDHFVEPSAEAILAHAAYQHALGAAEFASTAWIEAREWRPGDLLTVVKPGQAVPIGTHGVFIRQEQQVRRLRYLLRITVEHNGVSKDEFVSHTACARVGEDDLVPPALPHDLQVFSKQEN